MGIGMFLFMTRGSIGIIQQEMVEGKEEYHHSPVTGVGDGTYLMQHPMSQYSLSYFSV